MPASVEFSIKLVVCLLPWQATGLHEPQRHSLSHKHVTATADDKDETRTAQKAAEAAALAQEGVMMARSDSPKHKKKFRV